MSTFKSPFVLLLGVSLILGGCSLLDSQEGDSQESSSAAMSGNADFDNMMSAVASRYKEVDKMGGAWAYSKDTLEKAAEAAKNNDIEKAMKLLKEVDNEVALAKAQFEAQKNAGPHLF